MHGSRLLCTLPILLAAARKAVNGCKEVHTAERHRNTRYWLFAASVLAGVGVGAGAAPAFASSPVGPLPAPKAVHSVAPTTTSASGASASGTSGSGLGAPAPLVGAQPEGLRQRPLAANPVAVDTGSVWSAGGLGATTVLTVPVALGGLVAAFMVVQWLIDRRDPRLTEAPARMEENSVGFE